MANSHENSCGQCTALLADLRACRAERDAAIAILTAASGEAHHEGTRTTDLVGLAREVAAGVSTLDEEATRMDGWAVTAMRAARAWKRLAREQRHRLKEMDAERDAMRDRAERAEAEAACARDARTLAWEMAEQTTDALKRVGEARDAAQADATTWRDRCEASFEDVASLQGCLERATADAAALREGLRYVVHAVGNGTNLLADAEYIARLRALAKGGE